jgi:putative SOS response-associated peptidase YedK
MCGRYVRYTPIDRYAERFGCDAVAADLDPTPSYNVAPSQPVLAARTTAGGRRELTALKWGLLPAWAKEPKLPYATINARAETVAEKPAFRAAFRKRRCLIAADGFYEWQKTGNHKQPFFIRLADRSPFAFAGLWEHWEQAGEAIESCAIIVTEANALMRTIHDRMPVILSPDDYDLWLDPEIGDPARLTPLLVPYPAERMEAWPVGTAVNSPRNDGPELLAAVG